jgi:hypothetical protein
MILNTALSGQRWGLANASWSETTDLGSDANSIGMDSTGQSGLTDLLSAR